MTWDEYGKTQDPNVLYVVIENRFEPGELGSAEYTFTRFDKADDHAAQLAEELADAFEEPFEKLDPGYYRIGTPDEPWSIIQVQATQLLGVGQG